MKKLSFLLLLPILSCQPIPQQPTPNGDNTNTIIIGTNPSSPSNPSETCLPVDRVRIVTFPSALSVGVSAAIDVTPRDQFGNIRSDNCNEVSGNHWDSNTDVCLVSQPNDFRSNVRGVKSGTCELTACVSGHCDSVKFPVS
jgi:hypothetical protein